MKFLCTISCILFLGAVGCTSNQKIFHPAERQTALFPNGTYQHEITLKMANGEEHSFHGVVQIKTDLITVVGLSGFSSTLFRVKEDRQEGKTDVEIFYEPFKKYEEKLRQLYGVVRGFLVLNSEGVQDPNLSIRQRNEKGEPTEVLLKLEDKNVTLKFSDYDEHRIPSKIEIIHPGFLVTVQVVGYDI